MPKETKIADIRTTNIILHTDKFNLSLLEEGFKIIAYQIPEPDAKTEEYFARFDNTKGRYVFTEQGYARIQNFFKDELNDPFYYNSPTKMLYIFCKKDTKETTLQIPFLNNCKVLPQNTSFRELIESKTYKGYSQLHILLKLLVAHYHHILEEHKMWQSKFFVYAKEKEDKKDKYHIGLQLSIKDDWKKNSENNPQKNFLLEFKPTIFFNISSEKLEKESNIHVLCNHYYEQKNVKINDKITPYLYQVKSSAVKNLKKELFKELTPALRRTMDKEYRAGLDWFDYNNPYQSRLPIIAHFQKEFITMLNQCGLTAEIPLSSYTKFNPSKNKELKLSLLTEINVLDLRENKENYPIESYIGFLENATKEIFKLNPIDTSPIKYQLIQEQALSEFIPTVVLYDCNSDACKKYGIIDKKQKLYKKYPNRIVQTLIVNDKESKFIAKKEDYLNYKLIICEQKGDKNKWVYSPKELKHKMSVILNELFLKSFVKGQRKVIDKDYTLPCFESFEPQTNVFSKYQMADIAFLYHFQFSKDEKHRVLMYIQDNYLRFIDKNPEINKQLEQYSLSNSQLLEFFNQKFKEGEDIGNDDNAIFIIAKGLCLEIERLELCAMPDIEKLLIAKNDREEEEKTITKIKGINTVYQTDNPVKDTLYQYKGLWYNEEENTYFVGSNDKNPFDSRKTKGTQDKAYHIYKIHIHKNEIDFDLSILYEAMTITYVRNEQYTVIPYFFDLIRLFKE